MSIAIGCCTSCLMPYYPLPQAVNELGSLGFRKVEINVSGDGMFPPDMVPETRDGLFSAIRDNGITINLHLDLNYLYRRAAKEGREYPELFAYLVDPFFAWINAVPVQMVTFDALYASSFAESVTRHVPLSRLRKWKDGLASALGGRRMQMLVHQTAPFRRQETVDALRYALGKARGSPLRVGVENYLDGTCTREELLALRSEVPDDWGLLLDIGHAHLALSRGGTRSFSDYLRSVPVPIIDVHISDNDGVSDQHLSLGKGTCDLRSALTALKESGYEGDIMLEITGSSAAGVKEELSRSREFVESIIYQIERGS